MKRRKTLWFSLASVTAMILVILGTPVLGVEPNREQDEATLAAKFRDQLKDGNWIDRRKGDEALEVRALITLINEESTRGGNNALKHRALRELEKYPNSEEGILILLREIRFEPPVRSAKDPLATYTAASVLSKMGVRARSKMLRSGLNKPVSDPELYLRGVVLVMLDGDQGEWKLAKEITLKRVGHLLGKVEEEPGEGEAAEHKAAILYNLKRMTSLIEDPTFSAWRIPDPDEPPK